MSRDYNYYNYEPPKQPRRITTWEPPEEKQNPPQNKNIQSNYSLQNDPHGYNEKSINPSHMNQPEAAKHYGRSENYSGISSYEERKPQQIPFSHTSHETDDVYTSNEETVVMHPFARSHKFKVNEPKEDVPGDSVNNLLKSLGLDTTLISPPPVKSILKSSKPQTSISPVATFEGVDFKKLLGAPTSETLESNQVQQSRGFETDNTSLKSESKYSRRDFLRNSESRQGIHKEPESSQQGRNSESYLSRQGIHKKPESSQQGRDLNLPRGSKDRDPEPYLPRHDMYEETESFQQERVSKSTLPRQSNDREPGPYLPRHDMHEEIESSHQGRVSQSTLPRRSNDREPDPYLPRQDARMEPESNRARYDTEREFDSSLPIIKDDRDFTDNKKRQSKFSGPSKGEMQKPGRQNHECDVQRRNVENPNIHFQKRQPEGNVFDSYQRRADQVYESGSMQPINVNSDLNLTRTNDNYTYSPSFVKKGMDRDLDSNKKSMDIENRSQFSSWDKIHDSRDEIREFYRSDSDLPRRGNAMDSTSDRDSKTDLSQKGMESFHDRRNTSREPIQDIDSRNPQRRSLNRDSMDHITNQVSLSPERNGSRNSRGHVTMDSNRDDIAHHRVESSVVKQYTDPNTDPNYTMVNMAYQGGPVMGPIQGGSVMGPIQGGSVMGPIQGGPVMGYGYQGFQLPYQNMGHLPMSPHPMAPVMSSQLINHPTQGYIDNKNEYPRPIGYQEGSSTSREFSTQSVNKLSPDFGYLDSRVDDKRSPIPYEANPEHKTRDRHYRSDTRERVSRSPFEQDAPISSERKKDSIDSDDPLANLALLKNLPPDLQAQVRAALTKSLSEKIVSEARSADAIIDTRSVHIRTDSDKDRLPEPKQRSISPSRSKFDTRKVVEPNRDRSPFSTSVASRNPDKKSTKRKSRSRSPWEINKSDTRSVQMHLESKKDLEPKKVKGREINESDANALRAYLTRLEKFQKMINKELKELQQDSVDIQKRNPTGEQKITQKNLLTINSKLLQSARQSETEVMAEIFKMKGICDTFDKKYPLPKKTTSETIYEDRDDYWCECCKVVNSPLSEAIKHLHSKKHIETMTDSVPWSTKKLVPRKANAGNAKGHEFLHAIDGFYCKPCKQFFGDEEDYAHHMTTGEHYEAYKVHTWKLPDYERLYFLRRQKCLAEIDAQKKKEDEKARLQNLMERKRRSEFLVKKAAKESRLVDIFQEQDMEVDSPPDSPKSSTNGKREQRGAYSSSSMDYGGSKHGKSGTHSSGKSSQPTSSPSKNRSTSENTTLLGKPVRSIKRVHNTSNTTATSLSSPMSTKTKPSSPKKPDILGLPPRKIKTLQPPPPLPKSFR